MADDFYLDEPGFEKVAKSVEDAGGKLTAAHRQLNDVLIAYQGCWGDDEAGMAFQGNYWESAEEVRTGTAGAGDGLTGAAQTGRRNAQRFASVDKTTAKVLDSQVQ